MAVKATMSRTIERSVPGRGAVVGEAERSCCVATASPRPTGVVRMLRERPEFGSLPPHVLSVLA